MAQHKFITKVVERYYERAALNLTRFRGWMRRQKFLLFIVSADAFLYSALSILRHLHFESGWDLAMFDQAVWLYSRFHAPNVTLRFNEPVSLLGDHFHPILASFAPLFWIVNRAESLLVGQALLVALSVIPVFLFAKKRLGRDAARVWALSYSLFWGLQATIEFEFHEVAFAVPLIAFAIYFIDSRNRNGYFASLILLLITKEDMTVMVMCFGVYLLLLKQYRDGLISFAAGAACYPLLTKLAIPFMSGKRFLHWTYDSLGPNPTSAIRTIITRPAFTLRLLITPYAKLRTYWLLFSPFLFLSLFSPILILALPNLAERFFSEREMLWEPHFHYNATITPVIAMAAADGIGRLASLVSPDQARRRLITILCCIILAINVFMLPGLPLWRLSSRDFWRLRNSDKIGRLALAKIPADATVTAQVNIAPHLANRRKIYVIYPTMSVPDSDYVIASSQVSYSPFATYREIEDYLRGQEEKGYLRVFDRDGWVVLKRPLSTQSTATVVATDKEGGTNGRNLNSTSFFVRQQYLDFLGREPDPPGLTGWVNTINRCSGDTTQCDRIHVSQLFFQSEEFKSRGYFVYRFNPVAFGRKPDYAEFVPDFKRVSGFLDNNQLEAAKAQFIADFIARPAFANQYNSLRNSTYVDTLIDMAAVKLPNRRALIEGLNNGTKTRAQVLREIAESAEVYQEYYNQAFVVMEYFGYLGRDPDALYLDWIKVLDQTKNPRNMVTGFINSAEYRQRFRQ